MFEVLDKEWNGVRCLACTQAERKIIYMQMPLVPKAEAESTIHWGGCIDAPKLWKYFEQLMHSVAPSAEAARYSMLLTSGPRMSNWRPLSKEPSRFAMSRHFNRFEGTVRSDGLQDFVLWAQMNNTEEQAQAGDTIGLAFRPEHFDLVMRIIPEMTAETALPAVTLSTATEATAFILRKAGFSIPELGSQGAAELGLPSDVERR